MRLRVTNGDHYCGYTSQSLDVLKYFCGHDLLFVFRRPNFLLATRLAEMNAVALSRQAEPCRSGARRDRQHGRVKWTQARHWRRRQAQAFSSYPPNWRICSLLPRRNRPIGEANRDCGRFRPPVALMPRRIRSQPGSARWSIQPERHNQKSDRRAISGSPAVASTPTNGH